MEVAVASSSLVTPPALNKRVFFYQIERNVQQLKYYVKYILRFFKFLFSNSFYNAFILKKRM